MADDYINIGNDASSLQGTPVDTTAPTSGQVLKYNATTGRWEPGTDNDSGGGGGSGADPGAQYVVMSVTASLANERALAAGTGLTLADGGAGGNVTFAISDGVVATISGSNFSGPVLATGGLSGSLQRTTAGLSYLVGGTGITVSSASNGQVTLGISDGVVATVSGTTFTGPVVGASNGGFTGSLTRLTDGSPFITVASGNIITISTGSNGQIILSGSGDGGGAGGAPTTAQYLALAADATLSAERVFTPGTGLKATDSGAGAAYTLNVDDSVVATLSGSRFTGPVTGSAGFSGSFIQLTGGSPGNSNGAITVPYALNQTILSLQGSAMTTYYPFITHTSNATMTLGKTDWWVLNLYSYGIGLWGANATSGIKFYQPSGAEIGRVLGSYWVFGRGDSFTAPATDVVVAFSGSVGVDAGATRRVIVVHDTVMSGSTQRQLPTTAPNVTKWNFVSQSVTSNATPTLVYSWTIPSGSQSVYATIDATSANVAQVASINQATLFRNAVGSVSQDTVLGGTDMGRLATSGSAWDISIVNSTTTGQLWVTGSASTTVTWQIDLTVKETRP
jgi:hypothetical protein